MNCPNCGKEIGPDSTKCEHCGADLRSLETEDVPSLGATYIQAVCPRCGKAHQLHPSHQGKEFHCDCSEVFNVPRRDYSESTSLADKETLPVPMPSETGPSIEIVQEKPDKKEGVLFAQRYRIVRKLGEGGMGAVYLAHDEILDVDVAFKVLKGEDFAEEEEVERFMREARAAAKLNHPNIARVLNAGTYEQGHHYIAMEYIDGQPLDKFLGLSRIVHATKQPELETPQPKFDDRQVTRIFTQVAEALAYAHKNGIVHRDIKPGNVLIDKEGKPYLTDFGLAKQIRGEKVKSVTRTGMIMGTPWYMSPEQAEGKSGRVTPASDVFSFGAMMYHIFCRRLPFDADSMLGVLRSVLNEEPKLPRRIRSSIHPDMDAIIMKCLEKVPARRYRNGEELAADLNHFLMGESVIARPLSSLRQVLRRLKRKKAFVTSAIAILLAVLTVIGVFTYREIERTREQRQARERAAAMLESAEMALKKGNLEKALRTVSQSLVLDPNNQESIKLRSLCETHLLNRIKAQELLSGLDFQTTRDEKLRLLEKVISNDASLVEPYIEKGKILSRILQIEEAKAAFEKAIELALFYKNKEQEAVGHLYLGCLLRKSACIEILSKEELTGLDEAITYHFNRILALKTGEKSPVTLVAQAWNCIQDESNTDKLNAAVDILNQALKLDPDFVEALNLKAMIWSTSLEENVRLLDKIIELEPDNAWAYCSRGMNRYMIGDYEGAITDATKAIEINPENPLPFSVRGWSRIKAGDTALVMLDFDKAVEAANRISKQLGATYSYCRAMAKKAAGDHKGGMEDIASALSIETPERDIYYFDPFRELQRGLWYDPSNMPSCNKDDLHKVADILKSKENDQSTQTAYLTLAYALRAIRDFDGAIDVLTSVIDRKHKDSVECFVLRALCFRQKDNIDDAVEDYCKATELGGKVEQYFSQDAPLLLATVISDLEVFLQKTSTHPRAKTAKRILLKLKEKRDFIDPASEPRRREYAAINKKLRDELRYEIKRWLATLPKIPPEHENGALPVIEGAGAIKRSEALDELLRGSTGCPRVRGEKDAKIVSASVAQNRNSLEKIQKGLRCPKCVFPCDNRKGFATEFPNIVKMSSAAKLLTMKGNLAVFEGKAVEAIEDYLDVLRLGTMFSSERCLMGRLLEAAVYDIGFDSFVRNLSNESLNYEDLTKCLENLIELHGKRGDFAAVWNDEYYLFVITLADILDDPDGINWILVAFDAMRGKNIKGPDLAAVLRANPCYDWRRELSAYKKLLDIMGDADPAKYYKYPAESIRGKADRYQREIIIDPDPAKRHAILSSIMAPSIQYSGGSVYEKVRSHAKETKLNPFRTNTLLCTMMMPCVTGTTKEFAEKEAYWRGAIVLTAIRLFEKKNKRFPKNLNELGDAVPPELLIDPCSGKQLAYHVKGNDFLLYSVGVDKTDNGGKLEQANEKSESKQYDIVFHSPQVKQQDEKNKDK